MSRMIHEHDRPDRAVIGTVGEPGQRTFFLQARSGRRRHSIAIEKQQAELLADRIDSLLDDLVAQGEISAEQAQTQPLLMDDKPLDAPIEEDFRAGLLGLGWNAEPQLLVIEAFDSEAELEAAPDLESDDPTGPDTLRIRLPAASAREFARRARAVVAAGRPSCPFCQLPLDPDGHICPRANGYRR
ncbi:MAG: hypothetical protein CMH41_05435 [Micrococcales bacterium]|nr:hypothetical protein [Micrococcales bacterium]